MNLRLDHLPRLLCYLLGHAWNNGHPWERACCTRPGCDAMRPPVRL